MSLTVVTVGSALLRQRIKPFLKPLPYTTRHLPDVEALREWKRRADLHDLIVVGEVEDVFLIEALQVCCYSTVIVITRKPSLEQAVALMRAGAVDYISHEMLTSHRLELALQLAEQRYAKRRQIDDTLSVLRTNMHDYLWRERSNTPRSTATRALTDILDPRTQQPTKPTEMDERYYRIGTLLLDQQAMQISCEGEALDLSPTEYDILRQLMLADGQIVSFEDLASFMQKVPVERQQARKMLSAHISNLRAKMREHHCDGYLENRRGVGYYINTDVESAYMRLKEELQLIVEYTQDMIIHCDAEGILRYITPSVERFTGQPATYFFDTPLAELLEFVPAEEQEAAQRVFNGPETDIEATCFFHMLTAQGQKIWCEALSTIIYEAPSKPNGFIITVRDMTSHKTHAATQHPYPQQVNVLAENSSDSIMRFDRQLYVTYANPRAQRLASDVFGISDLHGKTLSELISYNEPFATCEPHFRRAFQENETSTFDYSITTSNDKRYFSVRFIPEPDERGSINTILVVMRDVTQPKQAELALKCHEEAL